MQICFLISPNNPAIRTSSDRICSRWLALFGVCLACLTFITPVKAETEGRFEIVRADTRLENGTWLADALVDLLLDTDTQQALQNGVPIAIELQFELVRKRLFWTNALVLEKKARIELRYMLLSQRYVVTYPDTNTQSSYATLYSALRQIGLIRDYPLVASELIDDNDEYEVALRAVLVQEVLPGPLQMLAFWRGDFSLESEWYRWNLRQ
jgi:hypothetical protein